MTEKDLHTSPDSIKELINIVETLRSPSKGCPWDKEQTHTSLIPYLLEEAHEVADAIRNDNKNNLKEELGDLLLQVVLHAQIAKEENYFSIEDVADSINKKLIRRHPHVFGNKEIKTIDEAKKSWESIKMTEETLSKTKSPLSDQLKRKVRSQSAISGAMEISKKAANAGFEWKSIEGIWDKVNEELKELKEALLEQDFTNAQEELGDLMFTLVNIARWFQLSPEEGLAGTNRRFLNRFSYIESNLEGSFSEYSLNELKILWEEAKIEIKRKEHLSSEIN